MATNNSINSNDPIQVSLGGTGSSSLTAHTVLLGNGTSAINVTNVGSNGQILIGKTSADPAFASLTSSGGSIAYTTGTNSLNLDVASWANTTFLPTLTFGGGSTGITYSNQYGSYIQIGNLIVFQIQLSLTNKGSSTGNAVITNLPVTSANDLFPISVIYQNVSLTAGEYQIAYVEASTTQLGLYHFTSAGSNSLLTNSNFTNTSLFYIVGAYFS